VNGGSSVSKVTGYGMGDWRSIRVRGKGKDFFFANTSVPAVRTLIQWIPGGGAKQPDREAHLPPSSGEAKKRGALPPLPGTTLSLPCPIKTLSITLLPRHIASCRLKG
jgi:hypothetical protein